MHSLPASNRFSAGDTAAPLFLRIGSVRWVVRSAAVSESIQGLLQEPEANFASKQSLIHDTWLVSLAPVPVPVAANGRALLRRTNYGKRHARWRDFFRTAGPLRAFQNALAMEQAGLPTPRVLAAGVARKLNVPQVGYLLVEEIAPATTLAMLARQAGGLSGTAVRRVAGEIARLHGQGFLHGDLTINNVLLDGEGRPWFIDLERARHVGRPVNWRQAVDDFHRFARHVGKFSPGAQMSALRLLKHYCVARGWSGREREFAGALYQRLKHKIAVDQAA